MEQHGVIAIYRGYYDIMCAEMCIAGGFSLSFFFRVGVCKKLVEPASLPVSQAT